MALATGFILAHMAIADELLPPASLNVTDDGPLFCPTRATRDGGFRVLTVDLNPARIDPLQVHEVVVDSERSKVYVSLLTTSQLFELALGPSGELSPVVRRWTFNTNESGLHNIALSACHPGGLWVSTQYAIQRTTIDSKRIPSSHLDTYLSIRSPQTAPAASGSRTAARAARRRRPAAGRRLRCGGRRRR